MDFRELYLFVQHIKKNIHCRECGAYYDDENIRIIGTVLDEGYFQANCPECKHNTIINVVFGPKNNRNHRPIKVIPEHKIITQNDILDMQNFLKNFDGDFIKLFNKK